MKLSGTKAEIVSVEVTPARIRAAMVALIQDANNLKPGSELKEGNIHEWAKYRNGHQTDGFMEDMGKATPSQIVAFSVIKYLHELEL